MGIKTQCSNGYRKYNGINILKCFYGHGLGFSKIKRLFEVQNVFGNYLLEDVRIQTGEAFDTFIIELIATEDNPPSTLPGPYAIEINGEFLLEEDSYVLPVEISEYIVINLAASGGVWSDETGYEPSWGSFSQTITADESNLTGVYFGAVSYTHLTLPTNREV